jgi:hypothetical protein
MWAFLGLLSAINAAAIAAEDPKDPAVDPRNKAILAKLAEAVPLKFKDAPLEDVLKFIKKASQGPNDNGIPIFVHPDGLEAVGMTVRTRVSVETEEGEPIGEALRYLLGSHRLTYRVQDGLLHITVSPLGAMLIDRRKETKAVLAKLEQRIDLKFEKVPLEQVLKFVKKASQGPKDNGIPIYVDPVGLQEAEKTMATPVSIDAKAEPLKTSLQRLLKSVGLAYTVKDGLVTITSESSLDEEPPVKDAPKPKEKGGTRD